MAFAYLSNGSVVAAGAGTSDATKYAALSTAVTAPVHVAAASSSLLSVF